MQFVIFWVRHRFTRDLPLPLIFWGLILLLRSNLPVTFVSWILKLEESVALVILMISRILRTVYLSYMTLLLHSLEVAATEGRTVGYVTVLYSYVKKFLRNRESSKLFILGQVAYRQS